MQLGFVSAVVSDLSLEEVLQLAAEEGYDCVELVCWPGEGDFAGPCHVNVDGFDEEAAAEVHRLCKETGVGISGLGYYPNALSPHDAEASTARAHLVKVIDAAALLGLDVVNTFIGADPTRPLAANLTRFREVWPPIVEHSARRGMRLAIENCPMIHAQADWPGGGNLARSPEAWQALFEAIPSKHFGLNLDPSHLLWQLIDPYRAVSDFGSRIFHVHAKDTHVDQEGLYRRGILEFDWHVPKLPGGGDLDWPRWIEALREVSYDGSVVVEVEDPDYAGTLELRRQALAKAQAVLRPLIG